MPTRPFVGDTNFGSGPAHHFFDHNSARRLLGVGTHDRHLTGELDPQGVSHEICRGLLGSRISAPAIGWVDVLSLRSQRRRSGDVLQQYRSTGLNGAAQEAYWSESDTAASISGVVARSPRPGATRAHSEPLWFARQLRVVTFGLPTRAVATSGGNDDNTFLPWSTANPVRWIRSGTFDAVHHESRAKFRQPPAILEVISGRRSAAFFLARPQGRLSTGTVPPFFLESGVAGNPVRIQSRFGHPGNCDSSFRRRGGCLKPPTGATTTNPACPGSVRPISAARWGR